MHKAKSWPMVISTRYWSKETLSSALSHGQTWVNILALPQMLLAQQPFTLLCILWLLLQRASIQDFLSKMSKTNYHSGQTCFLRLECSQIAEWFCWKWKYILCCHGNQIKMYNRCLQSEEGSLTDILICCFWQPIKCLDTCPHLIT